MLDITADGCQVFFRGQQIGAELMMIAAFYFDVLRIWREQVFAGAHTFNGYAGFIATIQQNHRDIQAGNVRAVSWV